MTQPRSSQVLYRVCQAATILSLGIGYGLVQLWSGVLVVSGLAFMSWLGERKNWPQLPFLILLSATTIAAGGLWIGVTPLLLIVATVASVGWAECSSADTGHIDPANSDFSKNFEQNRNNLLMVTMAVSLLLAGGGSMLRINSGFWVTFGAGIVVLFGLIRYVNILRNPRK